MCRAWRRCRGGSGKSTQNTRKAVSRAKAALVEAKKTGDADQVTAARERLDTARAAHQVAKTTAAAEKAARHHRDVTGQQSTTTKDEPPMSDQQHHDEQHQGDDPRPRIILHNTNIATGNATVGSQHDVHFGSYTASDVADQFERAQRRAERAHRPTHRAESDATRHTVNTASGDDVVGQQVGFQFGTVRSGRTEDSAAQSGDVTAE